MFSYSRDPIESDPFVIQQRADEAIREQRWTDFIAHIQTTRVPCVLRHIADLMDGKDDWNYQRAYAELRNFEESEGWHGVLSAIARALREAQQQAEEVERRR